jgi:hypothetical protein
MMGRVTSGRVINQSRPDLLPLFRPGAFFPDRTMVHVVRFPILPDGDFPMARNKISPVRRKGPSLPGVAGPPSAKPHTRAHPALVHGFLIPLASASIGASRESKPGPAHVETRNFRAHGLAGPRREGPADDATFH